MHHKDPLSRLTGRGLKDVCLHNRTSRASADSTDGLPGTLARRAGHGDRAWLSHFLVFATTNPSKLGLKIP